MPIAPFSPDGVWAWTPGAAEVLGVHRLAVALLHHNGLLPPDCVSCGRIRWKVAELEQRRDELRAWVAEHAPDKLHADPRLLHSSVH